VLVARKETELLEEKFGGPFAEYKLMVHPFLPLRKFQANPKKI
jgi:protein-S-isoprenylcysteine O-methyltransferase Ste14